MMTMMRRASSISRLLNLGALHGSTSSSNYSRFNSLRFHSESRHLSPSKPPGPLAQYRNLVEKGKLQDDPNQERVALELENLLGRLEQHESEMEEYHERLEKWEEKRENERRRLLMAEAEHKQQGGHKHSTLHTHWKMEDVQAMLKINEQMHQIRKNQVEGKSLQSSISNWIINLPFDAKVKEWFAAEERYKQEAQMQNILPAVADNLLTNQQVVADRKGARVLCFDEIQTEGGKLCRNVLAEGTVGSGVSSSSIISMISGEEEMFDFLRAVSRLMEMQTPLYLDGVRDPYCRRKLCQESETNCAINLQ